MCWLSCSRKEHEKKQTRDFAQVLYTCLECTRPYPSFPSCFVVHERSSRPKQPGLDLVRSLYMSERHTPLTRTYRHQITPKLWKSTSTRLISDNHNYGWNNKGAPPGAPFILSSVLPFV